MKIFIATIGKAKKKEYIKIANDYIKRSNGLGKRIGISKVDEMVFPDSKEKNRELRKNNVTKNIFETIANNGMIILLDQKGKLLSSPELAKTIKKWQSNFNKDLYFVIGGSEGFDSSLLQKADFVLSFSNMIWPHELARLMLCEQIYRSVCILNNHPYHSEN